MIWSIHSNYHQASEEAAGFLLEAIRGSRNILLGIATGFSPQLTYQLVGNKLVGQPDLISRINILQLDEWYGLAPDNPASCHNYIQRHIIDSWNLKPEQCHMIWGDHGEQPRQLDELKSKMGSRRMDVCILGLGKNGHLALNEPGSTIHDPWRVVDLAGSSQSHPMLRDHPGTVAQGITIGLREILNSKRIFLVVTGTGKQAAYQTLQKEEVLPGFPASVLHSHDHVLCFVDEAAVL